MALSGSFQSNAITSVTNNNYPRYLIVEWSAIQSIADNTSTVSYTVKASGLKTTSYCQCGPITVTLGGRTLYSTTSRVKINSQEVLASGSFIVNHNNETGEAWMAASIQAAIFDGYINSTYSGTEYLDTIPRQARILTATDFNDEENPTITYSNPAGNSVTSLRACISLTGSTDDIAYRNISKTGSSYTFYLTDEERKVLRRNTVDELRTVFFYIETQIGDTTLYHNVIRTMYLVNYLPMISVSVVPDETTQSLTGNTNTYIRYYSDAIYSITGGAKKEASIDSYSAVNGSKKSSNKSGTLYDIESDTFDFSVVDSRGFTASLALKKTVIPYKKFDCKMNPKLALSSSDSTQAELVVNIEGNYYSGSFGAVDNTITVTGIITDDEGNTTSFAFNSSEIYLTGDSFTGSKTITNLDYRRTYVVTLVAGDALTSVTLNSDPLRSLPVFDWGANDFSFNVPISIEGYALADYPIETGTTAMGSNGTWYWTKWKSGKAECYGCRNYGNMGVTYSYNGGLYASQTYSQEFPDGLFLNTPEVIDITFRNSGTAYSEAMVVKGFPTLPLSSVQELPSNTATGSFFVARWYSQTMPQVYLSFNIIGRWK